MTELLRTGTDRRARTLAALAVTSLLVACGSSAIPAGKLTNTQASIRAAEAVGATDTPNSALYLKMARDGLTEAKRLIQDGDNEEATLALDKAQADAELSLSYAREAKAREEAEAAQAKIGELKREAGTPQQ
jgi:hypothetical protein